MVKDNANRSAGGPRIRQRTWQQKQSVNKQKTHARQCQQRQPERWWPQKSGKRSRLRQSGLAEGYHISRISSSRMLYDKYLSVCERVHSRVVPVGTLADRQHTMMVRVPNCRHARGQQA